MLLVGVRSDALDNGKIEALRSSAENGLGGMLPASLGGGEMYVRVLLGVFRRLRVPDSGKLAGSSPPESPRFSSVVSPVSSTFFSASDRGVVLVRWSVRVGDCEGEGGTCSLMGGSDRGDDYEVSSGVGTVSERDWCSFLIFLLGMCVCAVAFCLRLVSLLAVFLGLSSLLTSAS